MNKQTQDFLNQAPDHPMHSRLEPYRDLIRELRRKRFPYRKIALILSDQFALKISKSAVHDFVKVRSRHADQRRLEVKIPPPAAPEFARSPVPTQSFAPTDNSSEAIYARMEALKRKATTPDNTNAKPKFHYDGGPLRLIDPNLNKKD